MGSCSIIIADDHPVVREGIKLLIETNDNWKLIGEANDGVELLELLNQKKPDIVIVDLLMPRMDGFEALKEIQKHHPDIKPIVLSGILSDDNISKAITAGACGIVNKGWLGKELKKAIDSVQKTGAYLSPDIEHITLAWTHDKPDSPLSHREIQIVTLIAEGHTSREIGQLIGLTPKTVDKHRSNIMQKLGLHKVIGLVRWAIRNGYASLE